MVAAGALKNFLVLDGLLDPPRKKERWVDRGTLRHGRERDLGGDFGALPPHIIYFTSIHVSAVS
jgi:hypothetical protein